MLLPPLFSSPFAEAQVFADFQLPCGTNQGACAHDVGPQLGQIAFGILGEAPKQFLADDEGKHRVAKELQLLVVAWLLTKHVSALACNSASRANEECVRAWSRMARRWK